MRATVLAVVLILWAGAPVASGTAVRPQLRVVHSAPLVVRGTHFRGGEIVRVTLKRDAGVLSRQARATRAGTFTVTFAGVSVERCGTPPDLSAVGSLSGRVTAAVVPQECAAP